MSNEDVSISERQTERKFAGSLDDAIAGLESVSENAKSISRKAI